MAAPRVIEPRLLRLPVLLLLICILIAAAINVPWALTFIQARTAPRGMPPTMLSGAAAALPWPSSTPHASPWPIPTYFAYSRSFGLRAYQVTSASPTPGVNGFAMEVQHHGWPLSVVEIKQMWWDWNDPALAGPVSDPRPTLMPLGLVGNPILLGGGVWLVLVFPWILVGIARRAWRRQGRCCTQCGYPIGVSALCTECGASTGVS